MQLSLSEQIQNCRGGVVANPFQGKDKRVLFVCSMGLLRSATGARIYATKYNTRAAGSWDDALIPLTPLLVAWADQIVFVNLSNYQDALNKFGSDAVYNSIILDIPDQYEHMHPELIKAFETQYETR